MSYDYAGYRRRQYDFPQATQPFRPYQPVQPRRVTSWDPPSSRVEVLRPPSWPDPESPYVSHHLDPPDRRPRPRYQPIGYRDRAQDAWPRHRGGYVDRGGHLSDRGDRQTQSGIDRHPTPATQRHRPTCWDPPVQQQDRGYLTFDRPRRSETCWDRPHPQEEVRALRVQPASHRHRYSTEQPPRDLYSQPTRVTSQTRDQPPSSPTCWDSPEVLHAQPMYQPPQCDRSLGHRTTTLPVVAPSLKVRSPCPAQPDTSARDSPRPSFRPIRVSNAEKAERLRKGLCYHCPERWAPGHVCKQKMLSYVGEDVVSDFNEKWRIYRLEQAALLARLNCIFEENIDDEILVEDVFNNAANNGGANLDVPNDEAMEEIVKTDNMTLQGLVGVYDEKIGEVEKIIASFNVAQMSSTDVTNCWFKRGRVCTGVRITAYFYVDFFDGNVPSIVHRSTSLDVDTRFIPPCNHTPYLSILGGDKGRHSVVRYVFDPGGDV